MSRHIRCPAHGVARMHQHIAYVMRKLTTANAHIHYETHRGYNETPWHWLTIVDYDAQGVCSFVHSIRFEEHEYYTYLAHDRNRKINNLLNA